MTRQNIDFGIDLGTTNSAVAVADGADVEVLRNNENIEFTPSAVTLSASGNIRVGRRARDRIEDDPDNAKSEFKARMGLADAVDTFTASGVTMTPTELSAEVLKSLRRDVRTRRDEDLEAAVVTIPAAFELHQIDATRRAAELAGITAETLQEPTAAAFAYLQREGREVDREFWLVYDFGGGTFDAAVMSLRDGECKQIAHHGDNHLGGKRIDWAIVDGILIPAVHRELGWTDLARGAGADPRWRGAVALLKARAEEAKISLSGDDVAEITVTLPHADGRRGELEVDLTRAELDRLSEPFHRRSVELSRQALEQAGLGPGDIATILLVGGGTIAPAVRQRLTDELGIPIDRSLDPVTVVARGAAVYAATLLRTAAPGTRAAPGTATCRFDFDPVGDDPDPLVGGTLTGAATDWTGYTVRFARPTAEPRWEGPAVPVRPDGTFTTELLASDGTNTYTVELTDPRGTGVPVTPDRLTYRLAPQIPDNQTVLPRSVGVGLADRTMMWFARSGTDISRGHRQDRPLRTTQDVTHGRGGSISIPVLQGENDRPDRNRRVGKLEITATDVTRDVPAGSEIEVTVEIDAAQNVRTSAYVPLLDNEWEIGIDLGRITPTRDELGAQVAEVEHRVTSLERRVGTAVETEPRRDLDAIRPDERLTEIRGLRSTAADDPADADACESRLFELQVELDRVEDAIQIPEQMAALDTLRDEIERHHLSPALRGELNEVNTEIDRAHRESDLRTLQVHHDTLLRLLGRAYTEDPDFHVKAFASLRGVPAREYTDPGRATRLLADGDRALRANDRAALTGAVNELIALVPPYLRPGPTAPSYPESSVRGR